ncbi:hypothetical protein DFH09DRAFT_1030488 [Mycena vulgaris]|nr:hypothetical protein DFH09DRAFT_1030488 [Mycena vulgaris]
MSGTSAASTIPPDMPVTRTPHPEPQEVSKKKKPPACDLCKARRVLCHPTTDGTSCPRCIEKGVKCTTTPVTRGRPPKKYLGMCSPVTPPSVSESEPPPSDSQSSAGSQHDPITMLTPQESTRFPELSPELVHHLFECFVHLPQFNHPMFRGSDLRNALSSLSWQISQLPTQLRVLAHCVVAISASISIDHAILGPGPQPASLADRSVFLRGADLRSYGVRRAPMYHVLRAQALQIACEADIFLEPSEDNAASCFFIEFLESEKEAKSRPWAVAYLSHVRAIAASWDEMHIPWYHKALWAGYLMTEVLESTLRQLPVLVSHNDQLLISGMEPLSLQNLYASIQSAMHTPSVMAQQHTTFTAMASFLYHVTRLARELSENVTGDFARRHPLNETAVTEFFSSLTLLHSVRSLIFDHGEPDTAPTDPLFQGPLYTRDTNDNLRSCAYVMALSRATLVLALHRGLARRATVSVPAGLDPVGGHGQWAAERLVLLRRQAREMACFAAEEVARALRSLPSLPHLAHIYRGALVAWAQFCLEEAAPERVPVIERIAEALKLVGYSWTLPPGLVDRLEAYVGAHRAAPPSFGEDVVLMDMFPPPPDSNWLTMLSTSSLGVGGPGEPEQGISGGRL